MIQQPVNFTDRELRQIVAAPDAERKAEVQ
jgi:hypothetical protein